MIMDELTKKMYHTVTGSMTTSGVACLVIAKAALEEKGKTVVSSEITMLPDNTVKVEGSNAGTLLRLMEDLEEHDDIQQLFSNFDIDDSVLEKIE